MAGETVKSEAVCLRIVPWSRTSHVVSWLTPSGRVTTVVKGAARSKSAFLGQYDLNYTCEIVYYARARGELHALRECAPLETRDGLRGSYRALVLADHFRSLAEGLAPAGPEAEDWLGLLSSALDRLAEGREDLLAAMLEFEIEVLHLAGLSPELEAEGGSFSLRGERKMPVSPETARCIRTRGREKNRQILLDAARAIGVFYSFHLDCALDARRTVLRLIS